MDVIAPEDWQPVRGGFECGAYRIAEMSRDGSWESVARSWGDRAPTWHWTHPVAEVATVLEKASADLTTHLRDEGRNRDMAPTADAGTAARLDGIERRLDDVERDLSAGATLTSPSREDHRCPTIR